MTRMSPDTQPDAHRRIPDLAEYHRCQAELYATLAAYQHACTGEAQPSPGAFGLAVHGRVHEEAVEAILTHSGGGEISSGLIDMGSFDLFDLMADAVRLLLNPLGNVSTTTQAEPAATGAVTGSSLEITVEKQQLVAKTAPPPTPVDLDAIDEDPHPTDTDPDPTPDEIEAITLQLEAIHAKDPEGVKPIITAYKAEHNIGRSPFIKSITTRERLNTITRLIAEHTT